MGQHLVKNCPKGPPYKLLCGHCEWETSSWPKLAHHLNKSELHMAKACRSKYDFNESPVFPCRSGTEFTPRKIVTKSHESATVVSRDFELRTPSDVEPSNTPPVRPSFIETPPLLKKGALDIFEPTPPKVTPFLPNTPPQFLHFQSVSSKSTSTVLLDTIVPPPFTVAARIPPALQKCLKKKKPVSLTTVAEVHEILPCTSFETPVKSSISKSRPILSSLLMAPATETLPTTSEQIDTLLVTSGDEVLSWNAEQAIPDTQVSADSSTDEPVIAEPKAIKIEKPDVVTVSSDDEETPKVAKPSFEFSQERQRMMDKCRVIIHLADTIGNSAAKQPSSERLILERQKLIAKGLWPPGLGVDDDATPEEISLRVGDYYRGKLSALEED